VGGVRERYNAGVDKPIRRVTMSTTVPLQEAQARLPELIDRLAPGDEVVITQNNRPVAKLVSSRSARKPRQPGNCKGMLTILSEGDEHLEHFREYMP
jgi:prevent-host-death family protein